MSHTIRSLIILLGLLCAIAQAQHKSARKYEKEIERIRERMAEIEQEDRDLALKLNTLKSTLTSNELAVSSAIGDEEDAKRELAAAQAQLKQLTIANEKAITQLEAYIARRRAEHSKTPAMAPLLAELATREQRMKVQQAAALAPLAQDAVYQQAVADRDQAKQRIEKLRKSRGPVQAAIMKSTRTMMDADTLINSKRKTLLDRHRGMQQALAARDAQQAKADAAWKTFDQTLTKESGHISAKNRANQAAKQLKLCRTKRVPAAAKSLSTATKMLAKFRLDVRKNQRQIKQVEAERKKLAAELKDKEDDLDDARDDLKDARKGK